MKFEKLKISETLKSNLLHMGMHRTTDIQFKVIPAIQNGEDVLAIAQTGTGKTAAFAIPIVNEIDIIKSSRRSEQVQCLVLVPTRELARQIGQVFENLSRHTKVRSLAVYGGIDQEPQIDKLVQGVDVVIATPGRMFDLIGQKVLKVQNIRTLVLDEADQMLDLGFKEDIDCIKRMLRRSHQTLFFSATINKKIKKMAYAQIKSNALRIQVSPEKMVSKNICHYLTKVKMDDKRHLLVNLINESRDSKIIAFVRTKVRAERVVRHLEKNGVQAVAIHGDMTQQDREASLEAIRKDVARVLVATDVSARGIDITGINMVINYDLPTEAENYVHRIGRTGRGFAKGTAVSFVSPEEIDKLKAVEGFINTKIEELKLQRSMLREANLTDIESLNVTEIVELAEMEFGG